MPTVPVTRSAILAALANYGPMTADELSKATGMSRRQVDSSLHCMRDHGTQFVRISAYRRQQGKGGREAPVYDLGPGRNAPRPVINTLEEARERQRRYRDNNKAVIRLRTQLRRRGQVNPFMQLTWSGS